MSRYDHQDIMLELIELGREQKSEILQQLNYYRASVYKSEAALVIEKKIQQLEMLADLIGDELLKDAFLDYEASKQEPQQLSPGECLLSSRVMQLFQACESVFDHLAKERHHKGSADRQILSRNVHKCRQHLLAMCRQGSRPWAFFSRF